MDILQRHIGDALQLDRVKGHAGAKGDGRQQRQFVPGVDAAHVQIGVGLQIAQGGAFVEQGVVALSGRLHPGQNIVAGAVHDAHDPLDLIGGQTLGQGLDDRNAARDRRLEPDHAPLCLGRQRQRVAVMGQQGLVGGHHILACRNRRLGGQTCRPLMPPHHLDKHIDITAPGKGYRVGFPGIGRQIGIARLGRIARRNGGDDHAPPGARRDQIGVALHDLDHTNAHSAQPGQTNAQIRRVWSGHEATFRNSLSAC